jgi:host factor-I protein
VVNRDEGGKEKILNRKLIRPNLTEIKEQFNSKSNRKKPAPPEQTNAENYYFIRQMNNKTPMVIQLRDGEEIRGIIEWYDKSCIKVHRSEAPNLLIYKDSIKYLFKDPAYENGSDEDER